jgi:hypothetical protein
MGAENGKKISDSGYFFSDTGKLTAYIGDLLTAHQGMVNNSLGNQVAANDKQITANDNYFTDSGNHITSNSSPSVSTNGKAKNDIPLPDHPLRDELARHGIHWNWKTVRLANCPWVTPEYVAAHVKARPNDLGLVITLMLRGTPAPKDEKVDNPYYDIEFS